MRAISCSRFATVVAVVMISLRPATVCDIAGFMFWMNCAPGLGVIGRAISAFSQDEDMQFLSAPC